MSKDRTVKLPNCYSKIIIKLKTGEDIEGRVEYVNKTRDFFNHISIRNRATKNIENFDLENDVLSWEYAKKSNEDEEEIFAGFVNIIEIAETYVKLIPKRFHDHPKIIDAKRKEIGKLHEFGALKLVDAKGQTNIVPTKWVITEIENDDKGTQSELYKARLVMRGDLEEGVESVRRDSPTILKPSLRILLHLSRQFDWKMKCGDIKSAFLQGKDVRRKIFVKPPKEAEVSDNKLWQLVKSVYGTADGGRLFYIKLREKAENLGMKI